MMGLLYAVETNTINYHLKHIFASGELDKQTVIRRFPITAADGKTYTTNHYNLKAIIAVGNRVDSPNAIQFRKWANAIIESFTIKGYVMDDERLKNFGTILTKDYFEEQLERIREIRISERRFYQKITDIYATAIDYDRTALSTRRFFAAVQNKMHYAVHGHTADELICERADSTRVHMGLTSWEGAPHGKIYKYDVVVAKNYLTDDEIQQLERIVTSYLDMAEAQAKRHIPMTMRDWEQRLNGFLTLWDRDVLRDSGRVTAELAKIHAEAEFEKFRVVQDREYRSDFDVMTDEPPDLVLYESDEPETPAAPESPSADLGGSIRG